MRVISTLESEIGIISDRVAGLMTSHNGIIGRLENVPGIGARSAQIILSEVGYDLKTYPNTASFASWAGLCPGNNESAGKRKSGKTSVQKHPLKTIMVEVAWAAVRTKGCYYKDKYYRLRSRRGAKKAIIAIAHRIAKAIFYIIKHGEIYRELGEDYLKQKRQHKKLKCLRQQASAMGLQLIPAEG
jgi:transposase